MNRLLLRVSIVCLLAACSGPAGCCGGSAETANYEQAYAKAVAHEAVGFTFKRPLAEAWPDIVGVISEFGYSLGEKEQKEPVEGRTLQTAFKPTGSSVTSGAYRVLLRVIRVDASSWRLTIDKQYRSIHEDGGETLSIESHKADEEIDKMAWTIIQRVEPAQAGDIEKRAKAKAERAAAVGRGCDRGCAACGALVPTPQ